jgi:NADH-quinone oxidoreductase subunit B
MLIDALLKLHEQIGDTKLGANRKREIIELEQAALLATPVTAQKGLLR